MEIDLGREMGSGELTVAKQPEKGEKYYPCLYIDGGKELSKLPDSGTMTVEFSVKRRTQSKSDGKSSHSVEVEVQKILECCEHGESPADEDTKRGKALDKLKEEKD